MSDGIVVDHKETHVRYAISERNFNQKIHVKVRDLKPGETVRGYKPRLKDSLGSAEVAKATQAPGKPVSEPADSSATGAETPAASRTPKTEGSSSEGTKEAK